MILKLKFFCKHLLNERDILKNKVKLKIFRDIFRKRYFILSFKDSFNNIYRILADWCDPSNLDIAISILKNDEYKISHIKKDILLDNCTIVDAGAHIGIFTIYCKKIFKNSKIVALEPISKNIKIFKINIKLNKCDKNIIALPYALYRDGKIKIHITERSWGHTIFNNPNEGVIGVEEIKSISWDSLMQFLKLQSVDILKMDIEGAEYEILKQIHKSTIKPKIIVLEYHLWAGYLLEDLLKLIEKIGYKVLYHSQSSKGQGILLLKL